MKDTIRAKTGRNNGHSLRVIMEDLNATLQGWFQYFQHSHRTTFPTLDSGYGCGCGVSCANGKDFAVVAVGPIINTAQRFLFAAGAVLFVRSPCPSMSILEEVKPPTGEPDAGDPHVRFGGRGSHRLSLPLFLIASVSRTPSDMAQPFPHEERFAYRSSIAYRNDFVITAFFLASLGRMGSPSS